MFRNFRYKYIIILYKLYFRTKSLIIVILLNYNSRTNLRIISFAIIWINSCGSIYIGGISISRSTSKSNKIKLETGSYSGNKIKHNSNEILEWNNCKQYCSAKMEIHSKRYTHTSNGIKTKFMNKNNANNLNSIT